MELLLKRVLKVTLFCCAATCAVTFADDETFERDFDHQVQFSLNKLEQGGYSLTVLRQNNANFKTMTVFVARKAYSICNGMGFQITYIDGMEEFDDKRVMKNRIFPPLKVKINCP